MASDGIFERAKAGEAQAQYELGNMYLLGDGVPKDTTHAIYWYEKAAEQGHVEAQFDLFLEYSELSDDSFSGSGVAGEKAIFWLQKAVENGHPDAAYGLGLLVMGGQVYAKDVEHVKSLFRASAELGCKDAQDALQWAAQGLCYACGGKLGGLFTKKCKSCNSEALIL